ncbi:bis-aminopropyl spermidine synthase family protein [Microbacterium sp. 2RAF4]|uniref:bis-aminopropyl spermidine synthase family protein n=1 Tax=Microbacterium sp. 2RAF4 TaxID=3232999 RepID=UPI003F9D6307
MMDESEDMAAGYARFVDIENGEWGAGPLAEMRRHAWRTWYRPSFLQYQRLVAEWALESRESVGGLPRLEKKVIVSLSGADIERLRPPALVEDHASAVPGLSPRADLGQLLCDEDSRVRVATLVRRDFPYGANVAMLGDDDLVGTAISHELFPVTILDVDTRIGDAIAERDHIEFRAHDIREPWRDAPRFEAVLLDPADGSIALEAWIRRTDECLSETEGARAYLSVNPWRLGRRWARLLEEFGRYDLSPVASHPKVKLYPQPDGRATTTDLWVFERMTRPSRLPQPYLDIEVFR